MALDPGSRARFNLKQANLLLVEGNALAMDILVQILVGFGAKTFHKATNMYEAQEQLARHELDLAFVDAQLGDEEGYDLVRWIRHECPEPNKFAPVVMLSAHTKASQITKARDVGAHFIVAKPLTPVVLLERILWIAREQRRFVCTDTYVGPDRRFKFEGPPVGAPGRRADDLSEDLGDAVAPNMSQEQIDALMAPRKVSL